MPWSENLCSRIREDTSVFVGAFHLEDGANIAFLPVPQAVTAAVITTSRSSRAIARGRELRPGRAYLGG